MQHENSLIAHEEITGNSSKERRKLAIISVFENARKPLRDWDVLQVLFPASNDMNLVRPRISELHTGELSFLIEGPRARSHSGNRPVRTSILREDQLTLF